MNPVWLPLDLTAPKETHVNELPDHLWGDGPCTDCGTVANIVWSTDSAFWNQIIRQGDYVEPILCVPCFVVRVDRAGLAPTGWRLTPDWHWETRDERDARRDRDPDRNPPVRCPLCPSRPFYAAEDIDGHMRTTHPSREWLPLDLTAPKETR